MYLLGEGLDHHRDAIPDDPQIIATEPATWIAQASVVARLANRSPKAIEDPAGLIPLYIRKPEAEEKADLADAELAAARLKI